jgi:hypothetical protein
VNKIANQVTITAKNAAISVDFEDDLRPFYFGACGFAPTNAGLLSLD